jgi:hypothetical protein
VVGAAVPEHAACRAGKTVGVMASATGLAGAPPSVAGIGNGEPVTSVRLALLPMEKTEIAPAMVEVPGRAHVALLATNKNLPAESIAKAAGGFDPRVVVPIALRVPLEFTLYVAKELVVVHGDWTGFGVSLVVR